MTVCRVFQPLGEAATALPSVLCPVLCPSGLVSMVRGPSHVETLVKRELARAVMNAAWLAASGRWRALRFFLVQGRGIELTLCSTLHLLHQASGKDAALGAGQALVHSQETLLSVCDFNTAVHCREASRKRLW